ncbi:unnamed protein product [Meganyctiphanes norvegica]|uniref:Uncharacterized protein n=1 Tax=Meganyctiphanes norvegica TaxID=48144 RepID=A0AAV2Q5L7_MEGNR
MEDEKDKKSKKKHKKSREEGGESKKHKDEDSHKAEHDDDSKKKEKKERKKSTKSRGENEPPSTTITVVEKSEPYVPRPPKQPVTDVIQLLKEKEMKYKISVNRGNANLHWQPPISKVYKDNFGFGIHAYSPMIDYLNEKDTGRNPPRKVHLPTLEERCVKKFHSSKPVYGYDNNDIDYFIDKGEKIRTEIRQNDAAGGSNSLTRTHTNWSMTRKWVQMVKDSHVIDHRADDKLGSQPMYGSIRARSASPVRGRSDSMSRQIRPRQSMTPSRAIENDYQARDMMLHNAVYRKNDLQDMEERVNELTERSSARNQLLDSLRVLNNNLTTSSNIRAMADMHHYPRAGPDMHQLRSDIHVDRIAAPRKSRKNPDHLDTVRMMPEIPKQTRAPRVRTIDPNEQLITNTYANCIDRANDIVCRTPELREIKYRSHFSNIYKNPSSDKKDPYAEPSRTQQNIEHMADTLAAGGRMVRRYDVDDELPVYLPKKEPSCDTHERKHIEKVPSNSMRVRHADLKARGRNTLLGY